MFDPDILKCAEAVLAAAKEKNLKLATAESCTGGLIIGVLTEIAGSSSVVDRGFITYSNKSKIEMLGVDQNTLANNGAVSLTTVREMAEGAIQRSMADIAVSVSGVAGPGGGSPEKPVGFVCFGLCARGESAYAEENRFGDIGRRDVRLETVRHALDLIARKIEDL